MWVITVGCHEKDLQCKRNEPFIVFTEGVKSCTLVTKDESWGGWSLYSTSAKRTSAFSAATISSTMVLMFCNTNNRELILL